MPRRKRATISLFVRDLDLHREIRKEVSGWSVPGCDGLVAVRSLNSDQWTVTHMSSGLIVTPPVAQLNKALLIIQEAAKLADWSRPEAHIRAHAKEYVAASVEARRLAFS